ncbi:uncharacterized protein DEA37_0011622, partial [Paragonimus westermani]
NFIPSTLLFCILAYTTVCVSTLDSVPLQNQRPSDQLLCFLLTRQILVLFSSLLSMDYYSSEPHDPVSEPPKLIKQMRQVHQQFLDSVTPYLVFRWIFTSWMFLLYCVRVYLLQGFHVISYALGIFLLNRFIGFLSPKIDPETDPNCDGVLPTRSSEEFRPFLRRLPEMKFWNSCTAAILISLLCTVFSFLDI